MRPVTHILENSYSTYEDDFFIVKGNILYLKEGFRWDGNSGAKDTKNCLFASAVHDALCNMLNDNLMKYNCAEEWYKFRKMADKQYYRDIRSGGMNWVRSQTRYRAVKAYSKTQYKRFKGVFTGEVA